MLHFTVTSAQVTYVQPPPANSQSEQIPNTTFLNVQPVNSSELDNPGTNQSVVADSFPRVADPWTVNGNLTQFFPVNAPPTA
jgi:hypothetical protein